MYEAALKRAAFLVFRDSQVHRQNRFKFEPAICFFMKLIE